MFLHYVVVNDILSWIDYSYELPIDNFAYFTLHVAVAGIFLFIILYLKVKYGIHTKAVAKYLRELADKFDAGNTNISEE